MRRLWSLLALAIVACGDLGIEPDPVTELYSLRSVNGRALPYKLSEAGETRLEVVGGDMALKSNGAVSHLLVFRVTTPEDDYFQKTYGAMSIYEDFRQVASGRWLLEGSNLRLNFEGGELLGMIDGRAITLSRIVQPVAARNIDGNIVIPAVDYSLTLVFQPREP